MVPTLQHNHQHHRRRELERVLLVVGFVCIAIFLVVNVVLYFIVDTLEQNGLLTSEVVQSVKAFIAENQTTAPVAGVSPVVCHFE